MPRLLSGVALVIVIALIMSGLTLLSLKQIDERFNRFLSEEMDAVRSAGEMVRRTESVRAAVARLSLADHKEVVQSQSAHLADQLGMLRHLGATLRPQAHKDIYIERIFGLIDLLDGDARVMMAALTERAVLRERAELLGRQLNAQGVRFTQHAEGVEEAASLRVMALVSAGQAALQSGMGPGALKRNAARVERLLAELSVWIAAADAQAEPVRIATQLRALFAGEEAPYRVRARLQHAKNRVTGLMRRIDSRVMQVAELAHQFHLIAQRRWETGVREQQQLIADNEWAIRALSLAAILIVILLGGFLKQRLLGRFEQLYQIVVGQARGGGPPSTMAGQDEIAAMSRAFALFVDKRAQAEAKLSRAVERAQEANRAKSLFLATMSHEIRTPLNGMIGMVARLRARSLQAEERRMVEVIAGSSAALLEIISDVLDFSKIEARQMELEARPFEMRELLRSVRDLFRNRAEEKGIDLRLLIDDSTPRGLTGDPARLRQIISNLVSNAIKFTERGYVVVECSAQPVGADAATLTLCVRDTGIGIDPQRMEQLFQPFQQMDETITRRFGGSGLGLAICKGIAEQMGGGLTAQPLPEGGSLFSFRVTLPIWREADGAARQADREMVRSPKGGLNILLAEDDPINSEVGQGLLADAGHHVTLAANGAEAVAAARAQLFDLILMDLRMPDMDGLEATRRIRALGDPLNASVPVVALTADVLKQTVEQCRQAGMNEVLTKPIQIPRLNAVLTALDNTRMPLSADAPERRDEPDAEARIEAAAPGVLNLEYLRATLAPVNSEQRRELLEMFRVNSHVLLDSSAEACQRAHWEELSQQVQRLEGACRSMGLSLAAARAQDVQTLAARQMCGADYFHSLERAVTDGVLHLEQWLVDQERDEAEKSL
ncbi:ATP-binding protein [Magnetofaba australis]|uniref:histidine kinase n=1 Tax=Magnetofaba australis IT-1 TaxID=1434232 RepID=A0A1Y2K2H8_9PROT|nr:ATP-binding protein [Magnetofaba australis]OSM02213.1 putative periplasmic sensor hybrid histidine kinase [Magnetofaba australis IT-1]